MGFFARLKEGMKKTKKSFGEKLKYVFTGNDIDEDFYDELEFALLSSDVGANTTSQILDSLRQKVKQTKTKTTDGCKQLLKESLVEILSQAEVEELSYPCVILVAGVNGVGKTTTIGKLAQKFDKMGKKVVLAGADTFRAAASEQLAEWANRAKVKIVSSTEGADPASVVFDAITSTKARNADVLIIDTAGRLHNKVNLMEELKKINRIVEKNYSEADYHKLIVVDSTTGQNALSQVQLFNEAINITDLAITKLDGTSKGGFLFSLVNQYQIPVRYVGVGETAEDLLDFDSQEFVNSIIE